ncbi:MAG: amidohydrolase, partial [Firmicutes bacterium]|nr:amidohydrolase [Bacillota bacterium]
KAVGTDQEVLAPASPADKVNDHKGQLVLPGFVDSHIHFLEYAYEKSFVDLSGAGSLEEMLAILKDRLTDAIRSGRPLRGTGFNQNYWDDPTLPTRADLDEISGELPIIIRRTCHHVTVANTPALKLAGLEMTNPDGILQEDDQYVLEEALPALTREQIKEMILDAAKDVAAKGITEVQTDDLTLISSELYGETIIEAFTELDRAGELPIRVYEQSNLPSMKQLKAFLDDGYMTGLSTGNFTIGPLKLIADGALGARSAAMKEDYLDEPGNRGILNFTDEELRELVMTAHKQGMQIAVHGIGDRCIEQILDAFEMALSESPRDDHRHGIVHCQITRPEDIDRMGRLGIMAYIQPVFLKADQHIVEDRISRELTLTSYDWRTMKDLGIHLSGGSDCPVEPFDVLTNMYYLVTCREPGADAPWHPEKSLNMKEAIEAFTSEGAYASFSEDRRGKLLPGFDADFTVIDRDITSMPPEGLLEARIMMTFVGGKRVY